MPKTLTINVETDHILSLVKQAKDYEGIIELIWNSLDADAKEVKVAFDKNELGGINSILVIDNGHGIEYADVESTFGKLGGSPKQNKKMSPQQRILHGKYGRGRFKAFSLGSKIIYNSYYLNGKDKKNYQFLIELSSDKIKNPILQNESIHKNPSASPIGTGVTVTIQNIINSITDSFVTKLHNHIAETFASYYQGYQDFSIIIDGKTLEFNKLIVEEMCEEIIIQETDFRVKVIEWDFQSKGKTKLYLCNQQGIMYAEMELSLRNSLPISVYLLSNYIEKLHIEHKLQIGNFDNVLNEATEQTEKIAKKYLVTRRHFLSKEYLTTLKESKIYPFDSEPKGEIEEIERKVFDLVALEVKEGIQSFTKQSQQSQRLTLKLLKEAIEAGRSDIVEILEEVLKLPHDKAKEFKEILEKTSLSSILSAMKEVQDRLRMIYELRQILFDKQYKAQILERKHLHKIIVNETWIFGDDYTYGTDDVSLKNVLKEHIKYLKRDDIIGFSSFNSEENEPEYNTSDADEKLEDIPDVCLWRSYKRGRQDLFENLVIELKRPSKSIGTDELNQIKRYAQAVSDDQRFSKERTTWTFILLATKLSKNAEFECKEQTDRVWGHLLKGNTVNVYVKKWIDVLDEADARLQYIKEKLNYTMSENKEGLSLLQKKYKEYLPDGIEGEEYIGL